MNTRSLLITTLVSAFVGAALANAKTPFELQQEARLQAPPVTTRAEVRAQVTAALARGERLSQGDSNRNSPSVHKPHDVRGQSVVASRDAGAGK